MKPKIILLILLVAAIAGGVGWLTARHWPTVSSSVAAQSTARRILYYQSSMHPWIKSDKPGKCTICGMDLVAVYEGEKGFEVANGMVMLSSNQVNVVNVQSAPVQRRALRRALRVAGTIEDDDTRHRILSAYVDGRIEKLFVNYIGAEVVKGQPLAAFYSPNLLNAEREYLLLATPKAAPSLAAEQERVFDAAEQRLRRLGLSSDQIGDLLKKPANETTSQLLAPMTGTVVARNVYEGQYVKEGDRLFEIADFSKMWFLFDAYERDLPWLRVGQTVEVTSPSVSGKTFAGKINFIDPNLKDMTRSAKVRVEIANPLIEQSGQKRREILHRVYADGLVNVETPIVLAVPRQSVLSPSGQPVVYVETSRGAYEQRRVKLGRSGEDAWEVLDGLSEGERVVSAGNLLIDAQAQLNQTISTAAEPRSTNAAPMTLNETQQKALRDLFAAANAVGAALARDQVADFNKQSDQLHGLLPVLEKSFAESSPMQALVGRVIGNGHFDAAKDLAEARKDFQPFSAAVAELAMQIRTNGSAFASLKVFECPMSDRAFVGAPKRSRWVQTEGAIHNPFFGVDMLDCGTEVKP